MSKNVVNLRRSRFVSGVVAVTNNQTYTGIVIIKTKSNSWRIWYKQKPVSELFIKETEAFNFIRSKCDEWINNQ